MTLEPPHHLPQNIRSLFFFCTKVLVLSAVFSVARIYLFFDETHTPTGDHIHDDHITQGSPSLFSPRNTVDIDMVDKRIAEAARSLMENEHSAPSIQETPEFMNDVCTAYEDICIKTTREGSFSRDEQLSYQLLTIYLIKNIDDRLENGSVRDALAHLKFFRDPDSRRGSAGYTNIRINVERILSRAEFREVLTHELGHTIDFSILLGTKRTKDPLFTEFNEKKRSVDDASLEYYRISRQNETVRKKDSSFKDFVSGYAMKGIYEDFAEHQNARFNHNAVFAYLSEDNSILQQKYDFFASLYNDRYYSANERFVAKVDTEKRPRDSTRMQEK